MNFGQPRKEEATFTASNKEFSLRASPRVPKTVSQSKNFGKIEKNSSLPTPKPTSQSFGTWKKPSYARISSREYGGGRMWGRKKGRTGS